MANRKKRKRIEDKVNAGRSDLVPFVPGEDSGDRHKRRLSANVSLGETTLRTWAEENDVRFTITNGSHHWQFFREGKILEWWPSSAKLVRGRDWRAGIHCHDYKQALRFLEDYFRGPTIKRLLEVVDAMLGMIDLSRANGKPIPAAVEVWEKKARDSIKDRDR
jgi:hypothetical protein